MLKNSDRVDKVARFVSEHFRNTIEPMGYKAFLVAVDREACVLYKQALDKYLPVEYSEVVISGGGKKDPEVLQRFHYRKNRNKKSARGFESLMRNRRS